MGRDEMNWQKGQEVLNREYSVLIPELQAKAGFPAAPPRIAVTAHGEVD